jgi:electron transfer flavoprotein alpha subunit
MPTLSVTASIVRADTAISNSLMQFAISEIVTGDEIDTIVLSATESINPVFTQVAVGKFVAIVSNVALDIEVNGSTIHAKQLLIGGSDVTSLTITNNDTAAATIRFVIGG